MSHTLTATDNFRPYRILHYNAALRLIWNNRSISGMIRLKLVSQTEGLCSVDLDAHELDIEAVWDGEIIRPFKMQGNRLQIRLASTAIWGEVRILTVRYRGQPPKGLQYYSSQVFTTFHTSHWLVCSNHPADRATLTLQLTLPAGLQVIASGKLVAQERLPNDLERYVWQQDIPYPTYLFGFAAGRFHESFGQAGSILLRFLSAEHTAQDLKRIFASTAEMLRFFQSRAGVPYPNNCYTQVLVLADVAQEMSGFSVIRESYCQELLADPREDWLVAHELSHQWWGNLVTCQDWSDFWLNEGMATFMVAAFKEHYWGREEYEREIALARRRYERVQSTGKDRPLVHNKWSQPEDMSGSVTYSKGALVLNLLRTQLGDRAFWAGIQRYTRMHAGKSVRTRALQAAMEATSGKNLSEFFTNWVYNTGLP